MLRHIGYDAVAVAQGHDALHAYDAARRRGTRVERGHHGFDARRRDRPRGHSETIGQRFPQVTAVVSSGYSSDPVMASFADYGFKGDLVKPYTTAKLAISPRCSSSAPTAGGGR